jgi:hypothetical protein
MMLAQMIAAVAGTRLRRAPPTAAVCQAIRGQRR